MQNVIGFVHRFAHGLDVGDAALDEGNLVADFGEVFFLAGGEIVETVRFPQISYNSVAFSPEGQWLALASRDIQLWLKVVLSEEGYEQVKAGEERSLRARAEDERLMYRETLV